MIPIVLWLGKINETKAILPKDESLRSTSLSSVLKNAIRDRDYRLLVIGFSTCGFNMSIIESHRVLISLGFLILPKTAVFAFVATTLLGMSGDATVPPTSGLISRKFGAEKMAVLYGFTLIGHQIGAFASSNLGGILVKSGMGYELLWAVNMVLAVVAAAASFAIRSDSGAN